MLLLNPECLFVSYQTLVHESPKYFIHDTSLEYLLPRFLPLMVMINDLRQPHGYLHMSIRSIHTSWQGVTLSPVERLMEVRVCAFFSTSLSGVIP
jgi:hypothetical protein